MIDTSNPNSYFTICLRIQHQPCIVVGGGEVARRRARSLCACGAKLTVISPRLDPLLEYMAFQHEVTWKKRDFHPEDITEDTYLVVAATNDRNTNHHISNLCHDKKILCNVVDEPDEGDFIVPSTIDRGPLSLSISTSGISPALASTIRQELELAYGDEYGTFLELLATFRPVVIDEFPDQKIRSKIFNRMVTSRALSLIQSGLMNEAQQELRDILDEAKREYTYSHY